MAGNMTCIRCGETKKRSALHPFRRTIARCTFSAEATVEACAKCGEVEVPVALMVAFDRAVAADLARRGPASCESFRFIRKAIPLQPGEVSRLLDVPIDVVNRWDAGQRDVDLPSWLVVATIALETFDVPSPVLPRIGALREPTPSERVVGLERAVARTLAHVLAMLDGPIVMTDVDIADALGVALAPMRAGLSELAAAGLLEKKELLASGAIRWEPREPGPRVLGDARLLGIDIDAPLPKSGPVPLRRAPISSAGPDRVVPLTWRASS